MKTYKDTYRTRYSSIEGLHGRAEWLFEFGFNGNKRQLDVTMFPIIFRFFPPPVDDERYIDFSRTANKIMSELETFKEIGGISLFRPSLYEIGDELTRHVVLYASRGFFNELANQETSNGNLRWLRTAPKEILICSPSGPELQNISSLRRLASLPEVKPRVWPDKTVVVGVIDDGIAIANEHFRIGDKSRVEFYWDQNNNLELTKSEIDAHLTSSVVNGSIDEDLFYRNSQVLRKTDPGTDPNTAAMRASHGTHVLDLAAGFPPDNLTKDRPIIAVQLPTPLVKDTSGQFWEDKIKQGIDYIINRAGLLSADERPLPVVINFSFGLLAGPHDGTSTIEQNIDDTLNTHNHVRLVLPAGNSHLSRCHASMSFEKKDERVELLWRVQPDDHTASWLHIWMPYQQPTPPGIDRIELVIEDPKGVTTPVFGETTPGSAIAIVNDAGNVICLGTYNFVGGATQRGHFCIALAPTSSFSAPDRIAPAGLWKIRIKNNSLIPNETVEAWIDRDDSPHGHRTMGRQSYFDDPCYERFDKYGVENERDGAKPCIVKRAGLLNAIATGEMPIVVGGFLESEGRVARYSAGGRVPPSATKPNAHTIGPDVVCVSDDSKIHSGILAAGTRSGSTGALSGTSVAAPQIARIVADFLAAGDPADRNQLRLLADSLVYDPPTTPPSPALMPEERYGAGRIKSRSLAGADIPHPYMKIRRR